MKQLGLEKCLFVTINLVEDLLDLLIAPIAVNIHFQHAGLGTNQPTEECSEKLNSKRHDMHTVCVMKIAADTRNDMNMEDVFVRVCVW